MAILILGGTTEANQLALMLQNYSTKIFFSLAGITKNPKFPAKTHIHKGGFGGIDGLSNFLRNNKIKILIDATHPFAERMSQNAAYAAQKNNTPLLRIERPQWTAHPDDCWISVKNFYEVTQKLNSNPKNIFLTIGRKELSTFSKNPQHHYIIRSIEPPLEPLPLNTTLIIARPPFTLEHEIQLMQNYKVDILVTKNAGSPATKAKLDAARHLNIPVIMIERPHLIPVESVPTVQDALKWIDNALTP